MNRAFMRICANILQNIVKLIVGYTSKISVA
jgi:hypothetical protein